MDPAISGRSYLILAGVRRGVVWEDLSSCQSVTLNVDSAVIGAKRIRTCEAGLCTAGLTAGYGSAILYPWRNPFQGHSIALHSDPLSRCVFFASAGLLQ